SFEIPPLRRPCAWRTPRIRLGCAKPARVDRRRCKKVTTGFKPANHTSDYTRTCRELPCQEIRLIRPLLGTLGQLSCLLAGSLLGCHNARERSDLLFFCTFDHNS